MYKTINIEICVISKGKGYIGIGQSKLQKQRVSYDVILKENKGTKNVI